MIYEPKPSASALGSAALATPSMAPSAQRCFVYYDRHIEKNAGSTMRVLMKRLEEHGECAYWGYYQGAQAWNVVMQALPQVNASVAPPRLCGASTELSWIVWLVVA